MRVLSTDEKLNNKVMRYASYGRLNNSAIILALPASVVLYGPLFPPLPWKQLIRLFEEQHASI